MAHSGKSCSPSQSRLGWLIISPWNKVRGFTCAPVTALLATLALIALPAASQALPREQFTPVIASVNSVPQPVPATDGRQHIAYELEVTNVASLAPGAPATIESIKTMSKGRTIDTLTGDKLAARVQPFGGGDKSRVLAPGQSGYILMDISLPLKAKLPKRLVHKFTVSLSPSSPVNVKTYRTAPTRVDTRKPPVIASPLRGSGWVAVNGCCSDFTSHRHAVLAVDGGLYAAERFAIDYIQLRPNGEILDGPFTELSSYPFFGDAIHSVAPGRVVGVQNGLPETPPGNDLPAPEAWRAGGNFVVVKMDNGRFAFYAHLQPGTTTVKVGDRVRTGQVIGRLGSSGNSNFPHLHFHLMNGPGPLASSGVPYRIRKFRVEGKLENLVDLFDGKKADLSRRFTGRKRARLPLDLQVLDFGR